MKIKLLLFMFSFALLVSACQEKAADKLKESALETNTEMTSNQQDVGQSLQVAPQQDAPKQLATQPGQKLNPPHGEPGHDCKIPVGAPLGSGSGTSKTQPATTQIQPMPIQPSGVAQGQQMPAQQPKAQPGQKLNPPHGEPGHDCKIPVGAPLK